MRTLNSISAQDPDSPRAAIQRLRLECPRCGSEVRLVAFVTEGVTIRRILTHIGEPAQAPVAKLAQGPPDWDLEPDPGLNWEGQISPEPEFEFDQQVRR